MKTAIICEEGPRRDYMEDNYVIKKNFTGKGNIFGGVYDGHSGSLAAKYAAENLHKRFQYRLSRLSIEQAFIESYEKVSEELKTKDHSDSGTTAANFFIKDGEIFTANAGDSRIIIIGENGVRQLTIDHRLYNDEERNRIEKMGGIIFGGYACTVDGEGLMVTRAIGDWKFREIGIISTPYTYSYKIKKKDIMLIAACDGLFDEMSNDRVADFARKYTNPEELVKKLMNCVYKECYGRDNLTIIAVSLND